MMESDDPNWIELRNKIKNHKLSNIIVGEKYDENLKIVREQLYKEMLRKISPNSFITTFLFELHPNDDGLYVMTRREFQIAAQTIAIELGLVVAHGYNPDGKNINGYQIRLTMSF